MSYLVAHCNFRHHFLAVGSRAPTMAYLVIGIKHGSTSDKHIVGETRKIGRGDVERSLRREGELLACFFLVLYT